MPHGPGTVVDGRYRLTTLLGSGGMGEVWRASQPSLGRDIALKLVKSDDPIALARFQREARAASRVHHDNVVVIHDTGKCATTGLGFIAMELLDGATLRALVKGGALPVERALDIVLQMLRGLAAAHGAGIVHRDVKPENVMLVGARAKLVDFGIARGVAGGDTMTVTGSFVGTPAYTAPEIALGARANDPKADLYSVGCVLFELLAGRALFDGPNALAVAMKHATEPAPAIHTRRSDVPDAVAALLDALLHKDPARRPTAQAAVASLEAIVGAAPLALAPGAAASLDPGAPTETAAVLPRSPSRTAVSATATTVVPRADGWRHVFTSDWGVIDVHDAFRIVRLTRTKKRIVADEANETFALLLAAPGGLEPSTASLLLDTREAPPRNDDDFQLRLDTWLQAVRGRYKNLAVVVKSAVGRLQVERNTRDHGIAAQVFSDLDEAIAALRTASRS